MWMWMGGEGWGPPQFCSICYFLGVNGIRGAKHLPHHIHPMFGTLEVNLG
jgi:hypothetical protein